MKKGTRLFSPVLKILAGLYLAGIALAAPPAEVVSAEVARLVGLQGHARVIVKLSTGHAYQDEAALTHADVQRQRAAIARAQQDAMSRVQGTSSSLVRAFKTLPYLAMNLDGAGMAGLLSQGSPVERVYPDRPLYPLLIESTYQVEADIAHASGMTGAGTTVVVIDTGAEKSHPFLSGKVVHEACFATNSSRAKGACPNRKTSMIGNGAGEPCTFDSLSCYHGTHVSGIAVGSSATMTGVAPGATLIPIQVFHAEGFCSSLTPCATASTSDVAAALEHVYEIRGSYPIVAVNMSLGGGIYSNVCDAEYPLMTDAITNLRSVGIATIAAAGNDGDPGGIAAPGCISTAISVGAVDESDSVAFFSNGTTQVDLLAPGTNINSSVPGGGYAPADGTSMATPHVAGAWAILRQANGPQDISTELDFLQTTGVSVTDNRGASAVTLPRLRLAPAGGVVNPSPVLASVTPDSIKAGRDATLTVTGVGFVRSSVVTADGTNLPTTLVSDTQLQAVVPSSMLSPGIESLSIAVTSPPLGGGTSAPLTLTVLHPEISVSATAVDTGATVAATLTNGPGNPYDWMVLVPVGGASSNWLKMTFVPSGQSDMTWNVAMPTASGEYEIRLLKDGTYDVLATSETIVVGDGVVEPPIGGGDPTIALSTTTAATGETVTATMSNGPGNQYDWMVLVPVGAASSNWLKMTFVPSGQSSMTWSVAMPTASGEYEIRLLEDGSYNVLATSDTIVVGGGVVEPPVEGGDPSIALSATGVDPGETITATMTNGPGNQYDWMVLVPVGAASSDWLKMTFVPSGQTSMAWDVAMPTAPGEYEIRLLEDGGYNVLATSETITVGDGVVEPPSGGGDPSIALSATTATPGEILTATLSNSPGNQYDWMVLVPVGARSKNWLDMTFVPSGQTSMTWTVAMPTTPGEYEIRLLKSGSYKVLATSAPITVAP